MSIERTVWKKPSMRCTLNGNHWRASRPRSSAATQHAAAPDATPRRHVVAAGVPSLEPSCPLARVLHCHDHDRRFATGAARAGRCRRAGSTRSRPAGPRGTAPRRPRMSSPRRPRGARRPSRRAALRTETACAVRRAPSTLLRSSPGTDARSTPTSRLRPPEATRFIESSRTSPAANTPGTLVSSTYGDRVSGQRRPCARARRCR